MERDKLRIDSNCEYSHGCRRMSDDYRFRDLDRVGEERRREKSPPMSSSSGVGYIQHPVSKFDTLAGIAIKYGVEVADIKKLNGLVTDLQMFALKSLQIPLPGRHPPSPCMTNGTSDPRQSSSAPPSSHRVPCDLLDSFQSLKLKSKPRKVSPAMSSLQGYYGLKPQNRSAFEGFEMAVYRKDGGEDPFARPSSSNRPLSLSRKSRSLTNGFPGENSDLSESLLGAEAGEGSSDKWSEKLVRRRQKSEADFTLRTDKLLKEETSSGGAFSATTGKGLALRPKAASRGSLGSEPEPGFNPVPINLGDSFLVADGSVGVRKSSSTPSLQDQDSNVSSLLWSLKPDLQALSSVAITRPIFDGLPKPLIGRKNKAALD